jgi:hypothetical protein
MKKIRQRMYLLAFAALVLLFAGCKGESPTSPTVGTGGGTGGGVTPPTTASVTVTVSNATPLVDSTTVVTATVTVNNAAAANGTAVEFKTNLGTFIDATATAPLTTIRTTTNGVATAILTSSTAGTATITATVANVAKTVQATFSLKPVTPPTPPTPDTSASITSITPTTGKPAGGDIVTINGKNFVSPVRVLFDLGSGVTREAQVVSVSATQIQVISPPVDLGASLQTMAATIILINNVGSPNEARITGSTFTYQAVILTPKITTISPASGPIDGGTRVTVFGEGFQAPVQVFFGSAEAQVINVTFSQIIVMSPTARDTFPDGSATVTGPVPIKIININSAKTSNVDISFRYTPKMQITAMGPTQGLYTGGTRVTIDGIGFNDPVVVVIGGVAAQPIKVTGTQIIAITSPVVVAACADISGATTVTNVDNGDSASGPNFTYRVPKALILSVLPAAQTAGQSINVTVANAVASGARLTLGDKNVFPTSATVNADGTITFALVIPTSYTFATAPCTSSGGVIGTRKQTLTVSVVYTNAVTGCTDTATNALDIIPVDTSCVLPPPPVASVAPAGCADAGSIVAAGAVTGTATITISNAASTGAQSLSIGAPVAGASTNGTITIAPTTATTVAPGASATYTVTIDPTAAGAVSGSYTFTTNDPAKTTITVCVSATGT